MNDFLVPVLYGLTDYFILQLQIILAVCITVNLSDCNNKKFVVGNVCYWLGCFVIMMGLGIIDYTFKLFIISKIRLITVWLFSAVWILLFIKEKILNKIFAFFFASVIFLVGHSFCNVIDAVLKEYNIGLLPWLKANDNSVLIYLAIGLRSMLYYLAVWGIIYFGLRRSLKNNLKVILNKQIVILYGFLVAITFALTIIETTIRDDSFKYYIMIVCFELAFGILEIITIVVTDQKVREEKLRIEADVNLSLTQKLWQMEKKQYEFIKTNIDIINIKCHDMRHIINSDGMRTDAVKSEIDSVADVISAYDSMVHTGNEVLDIVLSEKSIECNKKNINLFCMADGAAISFLDEVSVYSLFGNAIENAMQYVDKFESTDKRFINVTVRKNGAMAVINVENVLEDELILEDGLPKTDKQDKNYHGFGMKSMRATVERYGGELVVFTDGGMFRLGIVIPTKD